MLLSGAASLYSLSLVDYSSGSVVYALVSEHSTAVVAFSQSHVVFCALSLLQQSSGCCQPSKVSRMGGLFA